MFEVKKCAPIISQLIGARHVYYSSSNAVLPLCCCRNLFVAMFIARCNKHPYSLLLLFEEVTHQRNC